MYPYLPIGLELQRRGHEVRVISSPLYRKLFESNGLRFVDIGRKRDMQRVSQFVDLQKRRNAWRAALRWGAVSTMRQTYEKLMRCTEQFQPEDRTVIVSSPLGFGARIAAEKHSIPMATFVLSPFVLRTIRDSPRISPLWLGSWMPGPLKRMQYYLADRISVDPVVARQTNRFRRDLGLPTMRRFMHRWVFSPDRIIGLFPPVMCDPRTDFPGQTEIVGPVLWTPESTTFDAQAADLAQAIKFAQQGDPPVLIQSGSIGMHQEFALQTRLQTLRTEGFRAILIEPNEHSVPASLPEGVFRYPFLPIGRILPYCSAVIHSGGIGTVCQSLAAGVPQMILPGVNDQLDNATRVRRMGAGLILNRDAVSADEFRQKLSQATRDSSLQARCQELAGQVSAMDSVGRSCDLLEELLPDSGSL